MLYDNIKTAYESAGINTLAHTLNVTFFLWMIGSPWFACERPIDSGGDFKGRRSSALSKAAEALRQADEHPPQLSARKQGHFLHSSNTRKRTTVWFIATATIPHFPRTFESSYSTMTARNEDDWGFEEGSQQAFYIEAQQRIAKVWSTQWFFSKEKH